MKRGFIQIQVNWIFVIIAGALIILLFTSIAITQKNNSDKILSAKILSQLESSIVSSSIIRKSAANITLFNTEIFIECPDCSCGYTTDSLQDTQPQLFGARSIFSPNHIKGNKLILLSHDFSLPFRITNFVYLTSPEVKYYFVYNSSISESLDVKEFLDSPTSLVKSINYEFVEVNNVASLQYRNWYKTKFVLLNPSSTNTIISDINTNFEASDLQIVNLTFVDFNPNNAIITGKAEFISNESEFSHFYDFGSMYGVIFSQDYNNYYCNLRNSVFSLRRVTQVYNKSIELLNESIYTPTCISILNTDVFSLHYGIDFADENNVRSRVNGIRNLNDFAARSSCPYLY